MLPLKIAPPLIQIFDVEEMLLIVPVKLAALLIHKVWPAESE